MTAVAGSIADISLKGRYFAVAADAKVNRKIGGFENAVEANGDGSARLLKTRTPWMIEGVAVSIDDARGDHEFLQGLADLKDFFAIDITFASGATWQGKGQLTDDVQFDSSKATAELKLHGPGNQSQQ